MSLFNGIGGQVANYENITSRGNKLGTTGWEIVEIKPYTSIGLEVTSRLQFTNPMYVDCVSVAIGSTVIGGTTSEQKIDVYVSLDNELTYEFRGTATKAKQVSVLRDNVTHVKCVAKITSTGQGELAYGGYIVYGTNS